MQIDFLLGKTFCIRVLEISIEFTLRVTFAWFTLSGQIGAVLSTRVFYVVEDHYLVNMSWVFGAWCLVSYYRLQMTAMDMDMDPKVWGNLSMDLLLRVLSHLSAAKIGQLRHLSSDLKKAIDSTDPYPSMFDLITWDDEPHSYSDVREYVFDLKAYRWLYTYLNIDHEDWSYTKIHHKEWAMPIGTADGGLVCLVSNKQKKASVYFCAEPVNK